MREYKKQKKKEIMGDSLILIDLSSKNKRPLQLITDKTKHF